jgi:hypothetical protein
VEGPASTLFCAALDKENVKAGVLVAVVTEVVNKGLKDPALKLVTVPFEPLEAAVISPLAFTVILALVNDPTFVGLTVAKVNKLDPEVVASPLISEAVNGFPPRTKPVNALPVPVPPFAVGTTENEAVGGLPAPPPNTKSPAGSCAEVAHEVALLK